MKPGLSRTGFHHRHNRQEVRRLPCHHQDLGKEEIDQTRAYRKNRFYSPCDLDRLEQIKELLQEKHINIEGVKNILSTTRCWEVKNAGRKREGPARSILSMGDRRELFFSFQYISDVYISYVSSMTWTFPREYVFILITRNGHI